jgi:translation initiation factor 1
MSKPDDLGFNPLEELDRSEARVVVRLEFRRFKKPVTIIQGIPEARLADVARELKRRFGAGGTTKGGELLLQGDHRSHVKVELVKLGFSSDHIDVI